MASISAVSGDTEASRRIKEASSLVGIEMFIEWVDRLMSRV